MKKYALRFTLMMMGLTLGLLGTEVVLRSVYPDGGMPAAHLQKFSPEAIASFREDQECGYLPVLGTGQYGPQGCLTNDYDLKDRKGRKRLLFVGDSATRRGKIIEGLRQVYGDTQYEYWNAGVESFNTLQELVLYRRHNAAIEPDQVILTFHNNDFQATPLAVREKGALKIYAPGLHINPWLFEHSYVYRWAWPRTETGDRADRVKQVRRSLAEFKALLAQQHVRFRIILLPILKPLANWDNAERWSREQSLAAFKELELPYFDMLEVLESSLKEGVVAEEASGDTWHPSAAISKRFAEELHKQGLVE